MISQIKKRTLEDLDINHSGFAWTEGHTQASFALVQEGGVEEVLSDDVVVNDNTIYGAVSKDAIHGLSGNDALNGGAGTITDSDGQGTIQIDGQTIGTAKGAGKRGVWVAEVGAGQYVGLSVYDNQSSTTGKKLVITRAGSTDNTISIDNFDLAKALSSEGYLGIKLDPTQRVALVQGTGSEVGASTSNVWSDNTFKASSLEGQSSEVVEANGKSFNIYLAQAAHAGDTLTLSLDGALASEFKARIDGVVVDADGAVITLAEGQTSVSFALLEDGEITADMVGSISASYLSPDATADSNVWALSLQDTGEAETTFNGDFLVKTETHNGLPITRLNTAGLEVEVVASGALYYVRDANRNLAAGSEAPDLIPIVADGEVVGFNEIPGNDVVVKDNTIYGTAGKDAINGLTGNDALSGGAGNDQIDGGDGADMIGGGAGADSIKGGDGNDFISSRADIQAGRQAHGPLDKWSQWGLPAGTASEANGATWGVYKDPNTAELTIWSGISETRTDNTAGDTIDAGAGDESISSHYKFRSCLGLYLFGKSTIRYLKTASKPSPTACASRIRARGSIRNTPNSIAACTRKQGTVATFDGVNRLEKYQKQTCSVTWVSV